MTFETRAMTAADITACVEIINPTIARGGTTAYETPYTIEFFAAAYLVEPPIANLALHNDTIIGFQAAFGTEPGIYSVGTFTSREKSIRGAGTAILAKITSDNIGGLAFYSEMGFVDHAIDKGALT